MPEQCPRVRLPAVHVGSFGAPSFAAGCCSSGRSRHRGRASPCTAADLLQRETVERRFHVERRSSLRLVTASSSCRKPTARSVKNFDFAIRSSMLRMFASPRSRDIGSSRTCARRRSGGAPSHGCSGPRETRCDRSAARRASDVIGRRLARRRPETARLLPNEQTLAARAARTARHSSWNNAPPRARIHDRRRRLRRSVSALDEVDALVVRGGEQCLVHVLAQHADAHPCEAGSAA